MKVLAVAKVRTVTSLKLASFAVTWEWSNVRLAKSQNAVQIMGVAYGLG